MIFSNKQGNSMRKDSWLNKQHCNNYSIIQMKKEGEKRKQSVVEYKVQSFSHVWLFANSWIVAYQAPLSMEFSRQEYWSGLPFPSPGDLPNPGIKPRSPTWQADALPSEPPGKPCVWVCSSVNKNIKLRVCVHACVGREGNDHNQLMK